MFGYPCPFCSQRLLAAPERAGQRTICPKCLKPIVIPKPEDDKKPAEEPPPAVDEAEADEVPINSMPAHLDDDPPSPAAQTPMPEARPPARIGPPAGVYPEPIPLQPAPLHHAAAVLVRNPDSVADFAPPAEAYSPTPAPVATPGPKSKPTPEPHFPTPAAFVTPAPLPEPQSFPQQPHYQPPMYPAPGRITGDHPAAAMPTPSVGHNNTGGLVVFNPMDVDGAELAAELTTVISMRMKPPAEPPSDLRLTTGLWIILTACGLALWLFCMMSDVEPLKNVALIGAIELLIGYVWVALAFGRRSTKQGFATLLPPVWVYRAANPPYEPGYRPLRFVVAGAILLTLYVIGPKVQPTLFVLIGFKDPSTQAPEAVVETPLMKLQEAERDKNLAGIREQLAAFGKPESFLSTPPAEKPKVIENLRRLARFDRGEVKEDALRALVTWSPDEAKPLVVAAITSSNEEERAVAYELIPRWNDLDTVKLLVDRLGASKYARPALDTIGSTDRGRQAIEDAMLPLLRKNNTINRLELEMLAGDYGGPRSLEVLEVQAKQSVIHDEFDTLARCIAKIKSRLRP
ncbi:hypothetical protein [Limnoglobus roseus]|uniref:HEAT repeat domain-containing protein n=1 Tax=Limnoglobus roseus TaxID=2598579 RepID=A0A5C1AAJ5_9BACT|nr:hypothetical protein [Limnoglobus roseus]QEL15750.1 hypothetical protein PX52LOC_02685 [Limnoglobus roseus]